MTDRELKRRLKKLGIAFIAMLVLMIALSVYTLCSTKADLSIYDKSEYASSIKVLGMNEDELKQYLSVFGNLMMDEENEKLKTLHMATHFIDTMCSSYEPETNENGVKRYDAEVVNQVIKEIKGEFIKSAILVENDYTYDKEKNMYEKSEELDKIPYCIRIDDVVKNGDKIEITYQLANMTNRQLAEYMIEKETIIETHTIKVTILNNTDYEYSKYFVSNIEEI